MSLSKKSFVLFSILFLFVFGLTLIPNNKVDATVSVDVKANGVADSVTIALNTSATITWTSSGANYCERFDNNIKTGPNLPTRGSFDTGNLSASKTFRITCTGPDAPSNTCPSYFLTDNSGNQTSCTYSTWTIANQISYTNLCLSGYSAECWNGYVACFSTSCRPNLSYYNCGHCCYSKTQDGVCILDKTGTCSTAEGQCAQR